MTRDNAYTLIQSLKTKADALAALPPTYFPPVLYVYPANPLEDWESGADLGPAVTAIVMDQGFAVLTVNPALIPDGCRLPERHPTLFRISYGPILGQIRGYIEYAKPRYYDVFTTV